MANISLSISLCLAIMVTLSQSGYGSDYGSDYGTDYGTDYGSDTTVKECYSCIYHVRKGAEAGLPNCADPFDEAGIPRVACRGSCAKIRHETSSDDFTLARTCMPNCVTRTYDDGYTHCCQEHLCNSSI